MPTDQNPKQLIVERIKGASNILVTVGKNPSVDALSAALGLTLFFDKIDKVATAVFSGNIPPAIEFLEPGKTFDENVDGLRDFIIALDKDKADRLRYKVEDDVVRVFITPYKTTITEDDLRFSQGDFNVDLVIALGVDNREDLDTAITAHGRILHDATTVSINQLPGAGSLGEVDWSDTDASSLCEMLIGLTESLQAGALDEQIATALLTGLVSATDRFRNNKTSPKVMTIAAQLMAAGANQQLIAEQLEAAEEAAEKIEAVPVEVPQAAPDDMHDASVGEMKIGHENDTGVQSTELQEPSQEPAQETVPATEPPRSTPFTELPPLPPQEQPHQNSWRDMEAPSVGGTLNATTEAAEEEARREEEDSRNHVLLSHDGEDRPADSVAPSFPTPPVLNASSLADEEPEVRDIFDMQPNVPLQPSQPFQQTVGFPTTPKIPVIPSSPVAPMAPQFGQSQPAPMPSPAPLPDMHTMASSGISFEETPIAQAGAPSTAQTIADLEEEVRRHAQQQVSVQSILPPTPVNGVDDARAAVDAAFSGEPFNPAGHPTQSFGAQPLGEISHEHAAASTQVIPPTPVPAPPTMPPLPDFSTLPPLPGEFPQQPSAPVAPSFGLPDHMPNIAQGSPAAPTQTDPGQFKLPGQY